MLRVEVVKFAIVKLCVLMFRTENVLAFTWDLHKTNFLETLPAFTQVTLNLHVRSNFTAKRTYLYFCVGNILLFFFSHISTNVAFLNLGNALLVGLDCGVHLSLHRVASLFKARRTEIVSV